MSEIEFGDPLIKNTKRVTKYELEGVAFVKGYDNTVRFTFEGGYSPTLKVNMEDLYQTKEVYTFFKSLLSNCYIEHTGLRKSFNELYTEWILKEDRVQEFLIRVEKLMGEKWKNSFEQIIMLKG